jgi:hypothetical protein
MLQVLAVQVLHGMCASLNRMGWASFVVLAGQSGNCR